MFVYSKSDPSLNICKEGQEPSLEALANNILGRKGLPGTNALANSSPLSKALKHSLTLTTSFNFMNFLE
jgi:hypothetical protein